MAKQQDSQPKTKKVGQDGTVFHCPMCKTILPNADVATFPFCSERCRLRDLSNWIDGKYTVTRPIDPTDQVEEMPRRPSGQAG
jgi:endogenous inhibitor of DNA gyrase (YacG/DUF329 family)